MKSSQELTFLLGLELKIPVFVLIDLFSTKMSNVLKVIINKHQYHIVNHLCKQLLVFSVVGRTVILDTNNIKNMKNLRIRENKHEVKYSIVGVFIIHPTSSLMKENSPLIQMILN